MRQCDGVWHFPWSRNACGIYSSLWLYIPNNCMLSRILVYYHFCCITAQLQERGPVTSLTQCTCQTSAVTLVFSSMALYSPLNCWHFGIRQPSLCSVSSMLPPACLIGAECGCWTAMLLPDGTIGHCSLAHCKLCGEIVPFGNSKHSFNVAQMDFYSLPSNRWSAINGCKWMVTLLWLSLGRMIHFKIKCCFCK